MQGPDCSPAVVELHMRHHSDPYRPPGHIVEPYEIPCLSELTAGGQNSRRY